MPVRLVKPWQPLAQAASQLKGQMGVFQLADEHDHVLLIGFAGGKSLHGLRAEVQSAGASTAGASQYRVEITTAYTTRYRELMMVHHADHGAYPPANEPLQNGRLSPG